MYRVQHHAYCGMSGIPATFEERCEARRCAAMRLKRLRKRFTVVTVKRGARWEILEPEECAMVPDQCGILAIHRHTFECRECGFDHDTREAAHECCAESFLFEDCE